MSTLMRTRSNVFLLGLDPGFLTALLSLLDHLYRPNLFGVSTWIYPSKRFVDEVALRLIERQVGIMQMQLAKQGADLAEQNLTQCCIFGSFLVLKIRLEIPGYFSVGSGSEVDLVLKGYLRDQVMCRHIFPRIVLSYVLSNRLLERDEEDNFVAELQYAFIKAPVHFGPPMELSG